MIGGSGQIGPSGMGLTVGTDYNIPSDEGALPYQTWSFGIGIGTPGEDHIYQGHTEIEGIGINNSCE